MSEKMPKVRYAAPDPNNERVILWPCKIDVPQDGGKIEQRELDVAFRLLPPERVDEIRNPMNRATHNVDLLLVKECVTGLPGLLDDKKKVVPDEAAKAFLCADPIIVRCVAQSYFEMVAGRAAKN